MVLPSEIQLISKPKSKVAGAKNLQLMEDLNITKSYKEVTTDPVVGTDLDGGAYYSRKGERFLELMGYNQIQERTCDVVKNRWQNTIQKALLKFTAFLNKALSEYHSGWHLGNFMTLAKHKFQSETYKLLVHELCWMEVKNLPKFCINTDEMTPRMKKALQLDELENENLNISKETDDLALTNSKNPGSCSPNRSLRMTPRSEMGTKVSKKLKYGSPEVVGSEKVAYYKLFRKR